MDEAFSEFRHVDLVKFGELVTVLPCEPVGP